MNTTQIGMNTVNSIGIFLMFLIVFLGITQEIKYGEFKASFLVILIISGIYAGFYFYYKSYYTKED